MRFLGDLVLTMLELREEQYDHRPEKGDVLSARVHVRRAGAPAPTRTAMEADTSAQVRVSSDGDASPTRWELVEIILVGGDRNAAVLEHRSHP